MPVSWEELEQSFRTIENQAPNAFVRLSRTTDASEPMILEGLPLPLRREMVHLAELAGGKLSALGSPTFGQADPAEGNRRFWWRALKGAFGTGFVQPNRALQDSPDEAITHVAQKSALLCRTARSMEPATESHPEVHVEGMQIGSLQVAGDNATQVGSHVVTTQPESPRRENRWYTSPLAIALISGAFVVLAAILTAILS